MKHPKSYDTTPQIRARMGRVHLKRGRAETMLAKELWHRGLRYRLNWRALPGSPDIAITSKKLAVFVDGEFWHGENWEQRKAKLKKDRDYWIEKIEEKLDEQRDRPGKRWDGLVTALLGAIVAALVAGYVAMPKG